MASFCTNCGTPVAGKFCTKCGATVQAQAPAPPQPAMASPAPAAGGGSAVKILAFVIGGIVLLGAIGVGSAIYIGYRAKQKLTEIGRDYGVIPGSPGAGSAPVTFGTPKGGGCTMLPGEDAQQILGINIDRVETDPGEKGGQMCKYWVTPEERQRIAKMLIAQGISGMSKASDSKDPDLKDFENLITGALNTTVNLSDAGKDKDFAFSLEYYTTGGQEAWDRLQQVQETAKAATGGVGLGIREVPGLGDKAMVIPSGESVIVLKGDAAMLLSFRMFAPGPDKAVALATQAAGRL